MVNEKPSLTFGEGRLPTPNVQRRAAAPQIAGPMRSTTPSDFAALLSQAAPQGASSMAGGMVGGMPASMPGGGSFSPAGGGLTSMPGVGSAPAALGPLSLPAAQRGAAPASGNSPANFGSPFKAQPVARSRGIDTPITRRGNFEMIDTRHGPGNNLPVLNSPQRPAVVRGEVLGRVMENTDKPLIVADSLPAYAADPQEAFKAPKVLTPPSRRAAPPAEIFSFNSPKGVGPSSGDLVSIFYQVSARRPESEEGLSVKNPSVGGFMAGMAESAGKHTGGLGETGGLSARYESGGEGIAAIGYDRHGGTSYGKYQISSRAGTMNRFLDYLDTRAPDLASRLNAAGPANTGGKSGDMPKVWKQIAEEDPTRFEALQSDFIRDSHYEPALAAMTRSTGLSYAGIPPALQEVLFSTAVQHGPQGAAGIISQAVAKVGPERLQASAGEEEVTRASRELIREIYGARAGKFGSSTKQVRESVQQRLKSEMRDALAMLE